MAAILRWFDEGGTRHRAFFRETEPGQRELVIGGPEWQAAIGDVRASSLEELTDFELSELVRRAQPVQD